MGFDESDAEQLRDRAREYFRIFHKDGAEAATAWLSVHFPKQDYPLLHKRIEDQRIAGDILENDVMPRDLQRSTWKAPHLERK